MKINALKLLVILLLCNKHGITQNIDSLKMKLSGNDSNFIKHYNSTLNFTFGSSTRNTEFHIAYPQSNIQFLLSPKETQQFSIHVDYKFLFLFYSFTPHFFNLNKTDSVKGSSARSTFAFGVNINRWSLNFDYQKIKGYYLKNTHDFNSTWTNGDPYLKFPSLVSEQLGVQLAYNFNKKFSLTSLTSGQEEQLKTACTFSPMLAFWKIKLKNEIPTTSTNNNLTTNYDLNLLLPVAANIVFAKHFYISLFTGPIIGIDFYSADGYDSNGKVITASGSLISTGYYLRSSIGYTNQKFFCGFDTYSRKYTHTEVDMQFSKYSYGLQAYIGMRLLPPNFLMKSAEWIQRKSPVKL
jgi:hypothetical protein